MLSILATAWCSCATPFCSFSNEGRDALLKVYHGRYWIQIETADAEQVLRSWP
jgi:hypothetical protein